MIFKYFQWFFSPFCVPFHAFDHRSKLVPTSLAPSTPLKIHRRDSLQIGSESPDGSSWAVRSWASG